MHDALRARLMRHIETLPDEQVYQVLDYIEFLSSKYARSNPGPNALQRFTESLEDKLRGQGIGFGAIKGTLGVVGTATRVVSGITEAGRTVFREVEQVVLGPVPPENGGGAPPAPPAPRPRAGGEAQGPGGTEGP